MGLLDSLLGGGNSAMVSQLARAVGVNESIVQGVVNQLLPAVSKGIKNNAGSSEGLGGLVSALSSGNHQRYLDNPETLGDAGAVDDGNGILGHIFGSKDVSRNVAGHAAEATGVDSGIVKKLLPLVASIAMGALSKETGNSGLNISSLLGGGAATSTATSLITSFLDADNDGDITDDLLNIAKKFF